MSSWTMASISRPHVAGIAGGFPTGGTRLEKFCHHWFTNDLHVMNPIAELGRSNQVLTRPTRTGMYYAHDFFKLSPPTRSASAQGAPGEGLAQPCRPDRGGLQVDAGRGSDRVHA